MRSRSALVSLTEFLFVIFLLELFEFGQSLAHGGEPYKNGFRVKREEATTERPSGSCCVCGVALYKATFISKWNKTTHPNDYPEKLAHFSTVVGGTHADAHVVWELGSKASAAVKRFTEWGDTRSLLNKSSRKNFLGIIKLGPVMKINKPISDRFRADKYSHYISMISKIIPSPDWFVGVDRFDLCNSTSCSWKNNITFQLGPIDAGTDSGLKFMATNIESQPTQAIHQIKPNFPNHPAASFFNSEQKNVPPMAEFKIELLQAKGRCSRQTDPNAVSDCKITRWSSWTPCSAQCGHGTKTRQRLIVRHAQNGGRACPSKMTRKKSCRGRNCTDKVDCVVSEWSEWTPCGKLCTKGRKIRDRKVLVHPVNGGKRCPRLKLRRKCPCPVRHCKVSEWSNWGACSKRCGKGKRQRTRELLEPPTKGGRLCPLLRERQHCNAFPCRGYSKLSSISG